MKNWLILIALAHTASALDYKRDIMPIFEKKCYDCHSEEADKVRGGLRLDDEEHFFKRLTKNDVVIPGDWDASYLFVAIVKPEEEKGTMPPKNKGERLTEKEIMTVAQWIHEGAKINGEKGEKGSKEMDPAKILRFKDGKLLKEEFGATPIEVVAKPKWENWTNTEGKTISAQFRGLSKDKVKLELKTGKTVDYPLNQLSSSSQRLAKLLAEENS